MIRSLAKRVFRFLGRSDHKIIAVYAASDGAYREAVDYVRAGEPGIPVWLVSTVAVGADTAAHCERVVQLPPGPALPFRVARLLWPHWVVLNVVTFTGEPGFAWLKISPFFVFPWKLLVMNEHRGFFPGLPAGVVVHAMRRLRDRAFTAAETAKDLALGIFWKLAWTLLDPLLKLTSQPWLHPQESLTIETKPGRPILIYEGPENAPQDCSALRALFDRPDTFAAGFQCGRSGFQKDVLPRAAFRRLQPGEATPVLAPLSDCTLVDEAKLAALGGFPRAWSRRCGWLLLYWKAARAGWKSYSVGVAADRGLMVPDRAFPEAEFCFRLLAERPRPLRGAGSFDNRRGSISFHSRQRAPRRESSRCILIVSPYLPFPLSHGGAVRIFNLARQLSGRYELVLLSFREKQDYVHYDRLSSCFSRLIVVDHAEHLASDRTVPEAVVQFRSRAMVTAIREAAAEHRPDVMQIEYTHLAGYREALPEVPAVLVEHDVTFWLHEQLYRSAPSLTERRRARGAYERWRSFESHWLGRYDRIVVMSDEEKAKAVEGGAPPERTHVVPNGVDTQRFLPMGGEPASPPELLYVGSFRHLPNLIGFEHLRREILPRLWAQFPGLRLRVVAGPDHERHWRAFSGATQTDSRILVEGFVEELPPYYARASVVVVPLQVSAGTNIKVMEALACGKPVVSTSIGCVGLELRDGEEILIANSPTHFAEAVGRLLEDSALRRRVEEQARQAAVERFSWERAAAQAADLYESIWGSAL